MWRPFASTFADHTYENFTKKCNRLASAPIGTRKARAENFESGSVGSLRCCSREAEQRFEEFQQLKEKVKEQRSRIRTADDQLQRLKQFRFTDLKTFQESEKDKRKNELMRIRGFVSNKIPKPQVLDLKPKIPETKEEEKKVLFQTSPLRIRTVKRSYKPNITLKPKSHKKSISVKEHQDRILAKLKDNPPAYYADLCKEFAKIREYSEMTQEKYLQSRKLKRHNPYKIRTKAKKPSMV